MIIHQDTYERVTVQKVYPDIVHGMVHWNTAWAERRLAATEATTAATTAAAAAKERANY